MSAEFWKEALIPIYFFYGLAFYTLGIALFIESGRTSTLILARSLRLLAAFGLLHGCHEWLDMLEKVLEIFYEQTLPISVLWIRLALLVTSFLALLTFGERLRTSSARSWYLISGIALWYFISTIIIKFNYDLTELQWITGSDVLARYIIGIPGATLACLALWRQRFVLSERGMALFVKDLTWAALAFALYGIIGQAFTAKSAIFPSTIINDELFMRICGLPIQLLRTVLAVIVAVSIIRVLRALEVDTKHYLDSIKQSKLETEKRLNEELKAANEQTARLLKEVQRSDSRRGVLLQRITAAQEFERKRIARELHDGTGQALTGIAMGLRGVSTLLAKNGGDKSISQLNELESIATAAIGELRHLVNNLRPPQLDDMGLVVALQWLVEQFNNRSVLKVDFLKEGEPFSLSPEIETTLFRIAQEGLTNTIKHAQANHASIMIIFEASGALSLIVADEGQGFDPVVALEPNTAHTAWGLLGMKERASLINADLLIDSAHDKGTTLTIHLDGLVDGLE